MEGLNFKLERLRDTDGVNVGDSVIIGLSGYGKTCYEVSTVQKVTKTQITVKGIVFKNGAQMGSRWCGWSLFKYDSDAANKIKSYNRAMNIARKLGEFDFTKIEDISELESIYEIVKKYKGE